MKHIIEHQRRGKKAWRLMQAFDERIRTVSNRMTYQQRAAVALDLSYEWWELLAAEYDIPVPSDITIDTCIGLLQARAEQPRTWR